MQEPQEIPLRHRDLNWLSFNARVLQEAEDKINPLYERIRFLAIFSSNLDEYFRVRVAQLRQMKRVEKSIRKKLALKPSKITREILEEVKLQQQKFGEIYQKQILPELARNNIYLLDAGHFNDLQREFVANYFQQEIVTHIKPQIIDISRKNELFLENAELYFVVNFINKEKLGIVNIPVGKCGRFVKLQGDGQKNSITFLDEIIRSQINSLFQDQEIEGVYEIKLSRDAELYIDDIYEGALAEKIYDSLGQRSDGQPTRLLYDAEMPDFLHKRLRKLLNLGKIDMMPGGKYHNFNDFFSFPDPTKNPDLHFRELPEIEHKVLANSRNYFETISKKDQAVHFPYMSFSYVENFLEQAVNDKKVIAIKISLYRVADESRLTSLLLKALENKKKVTVFVEAKARFDEENNIVWGRKFEKKGAKVIYSYPKIKVHSKIMLVQRMEDDKLINYSYIGTGNFNSETSKIYCDHAIFTSNKQIAKELSRLFKVLEGELIIPREKNLLISPFSTRQEFIKLIYNEIDNAREGKKAKITAKMNSLEDPEMIDLLYKASNAGVEIRLLVRGFSCLIPGIKGLSENIYITSIVDRFLEHGRIYIFENGGDGKMYYGSADWMSRNLSRRIEVLSPILDKEIAQEFKEILDIQLKDNVKARIQDVDEKNEYVQKGENEKSVRSQYEIYNYLKEKHSL
ncbi:polyphosphate kinase 1 [Salegentibacter sp. BLCTC]|uniref:polyphosphate kinase 1 n=1 Tax=Salegentibacter sp. BLCTC TaxID=2697368 RepID=UPI00187B4C04|nr:polyphosphate kinase 1 [Salegentibacter sp. BLCTC]MBE7638832.1 polyphosphate kinase 1 [Salegentibacter sp. BLCTC]